jgi:nicotinate (nicotinamide) nucleotide adenylyltransferase
MVKDKQQIVVLGGSFNPPTLAHYMLMKEAVNALRADLGFFVPVSDAYLKRKMRHTHPPVVLSPEMRVRMLKSMCADDKRLQVCVKEIGTSGTRTLQTLAALQEEYQDAELFFIMGSDKLDLLAHLAERWGFLDKYCVVLYARENTLFEKTLRNYEILASYTDRIVVLPQPEGTEGISSSLVREKILKGEAFQKMLYPGVWNLLKDRNILEDEIQY